MNVESFDTRIRSTLSPRPFEHELHSDEPALDPDKHVAGGCRPHIELSPESAVFIQDQLEVQLLRAESSRSRRLRLLGVSKGSTSTQPRYAIDKVFQKTLSNAIRSHDLDVASATRLLRGESHFDCRPSAALNPQLLSNLLQGYPLAAVLMDVATNGMTPAWLQPPSQRPKAPTNPNHKSCKRYLKGVIRSIREGQDAGTYMVVDANILNSWPGVTCSPLGAVEKKDTDPNDQIRLIHDLSFPAGCSTNDQLDTSSVPHVSYTYVTVLARRIEALAASHPGAIIKLLKGDVKGAYRHLMTNAEHVRRMGAIIPEIDALIIDLAAPFGWSGSPPFYSAFGRAISWLVHQNSPATVSDSNDDEPFFGYEWVDDHVMIEVDRGQRLLRAEATLRHAMLAVLGPRAINESKFSRWSTKLSVLGLNWDTVARTVSIPESKLQKGLDRIQQILWQQSATKQQFMELIGSLRHICICLRSAKPFYQQLQWQCNRAPKFGTVKLRSSTTSDLQWFQHIIQAGHLSELPLRMFGSLPEPDIQLYMDASDLGLAVLNPSCDQFIQIQFDQAELELVASVNSCPDANASDFTINVREHLCIALALWTWGPQWSHISSGRTIHVRCWSDNTSAVSWNNRLYSPNVKSQEVNRAIGLGEAIFNVRMSAQHLAGSTNLMADAASRAWTEPHCSTWTNFAACWKQVPVPVIWRRLYLDFSRNCNPSLWPTRRGPNTVQHGDNGSSGAVDSISPVGSPQRESSTPTSWHCSPHIAGSTDGADRDWAMQRQPSSPRSAIFRGIISEGADIELVSCPDTVLPSRECDESVQSPPENGQSQWPFCNDCTRTSTSTSPTTGSSGGLRSWASSFF